MTFSKKWNLFIVLVLVTIFALVRLLYFREENSSERQVEITVFKVENGFGYSLSADNKLLIRQEFIPAIQKSEPFCTKKDAFKTARLVRKKLLAFQSPSISLEELKEINIDFKCLDLL